MDQVQISILIFNQALFLKSVVKTQYGWDGTFGVVLVNQLNCKFELMTIVLRTLTREKFMQLCSR